MAWTRLIQSARAALGTTHSSSSLRLPRFYSKPATYFVKAGIPEFLGGIGRGAETHIAKIETEIGDLHKLLVTRTLRLKKLGIPCKHRKLILKYGQKYRLGLWKPRADAIKTRNCESVKKDQSNIANDMDSLYAYRFCRTKAMMVQQQ